TSGARVAPQVSRIGDRRDRVPAVPRLDAEGTSGPGGTHPGRPPRPPLRRLRPTEGRTMAGRKSPVGGGHGRRAGGRIVRFHYRTAPAGAALDAARGPGMVVPIPAGAAPAGSSVCPEPVVPVPAGHRCTVREAGAAAHIKCV